MVDLWEIILTQKHYTSLQTDNDGDSVVIELDFWDKFHDGEENVVNKIYAFHGMEPFYKPEPLKPEPIKKGHEWWKEYDEDGNFLQNSPKK